MALFGEWHFDKAAGGVSGDKATVGGRGGKAAGGGRGGKAAGGDAAGGIGGELREPLKWYAERYGKGLRTVKRWRAEGAPLEDPEKLREWWCANMTAKVPEGIEAAVARGRKEAAEELNLVCEGEPEGGAEADEGVRGEARDADEGVRGFLAGPERGSERGLAGALERLEVMEMHLAKRAHEPGQAKAWLDSISRMTATQAKLREELEKKAALLPRQMVERVIWELHAPVVRQFRGMYRAMCEVRKVMPDPEEEREWNRKVDAVCEGLKKEVFDAV